MALIKFDRWKILSGEIVPEKVVPVKHQPYSKNAKGATVVDLNLDTLDSTKKLLSLHTAKTSQAKFNQVIDTEFQDFPVQENDNAIILLQNRLNALLGEKNSLLSERDINRDRIDELNKIIEDLRKQLRDSLEEFGKFKVGGAAAQIINEIPDSLAIGFDGISLFSDRQGRQGDPGYPLRQNQLLSKNRKAKLLLQEDGNCVISKGDFDGKGNPLVPEEIVIAFGYDDGETGPNTLHFSRGDKTKKQAYVAVGGLWPMYVERWRTPVFDNVSNQARIVLDDLGSLSIYDRDRLLWSSYAIEPTDYNIPYTRPEFKRDGSKGSGWEEAQANRRRRQEEEEARKRAEEAEARKRAEEAEARKRAEEAQRQAAAEAQRRLEEEARRVEEERRRRSLAGIASTVGQAVGQGVTTAARAVAQAATFVGQNVAQGVTTAVRAVGQAASAVGQGVRQAAQAAGRALGRLFRSDIRLKTDIQLIGQSPSGINIYEFRYKSDLSRKYQGALANELIGTPFESAVYIDAEGYYALDYDKIDVEFKEII